MSGPTRPRRTHPAAGRGDKVQGWPPNTREFVVEQQSEIYLPAPFSPALEPRQLGGIYEIRTYTFKPGGIPATIDRWSTQIAERIKLSPLVGAWYSELGGLNKWVHIWAYKDAGERFRIREEARVQGHLAAAGRPAGHDAEAGKHAGGPRFVLAIALTFLPLTAPPPCGAALSGARRE